MAIRKAGAALGILAAAAAFSAAGAELRPHRALYDLDLAAVREGSEVTALSGRMALEWADACDGWTVRQNIRMVVSERGGAPFENDISFSSFETKAGDRLQFAMRWRSRGELAEEFSGRAETGPSGGHAEYSTPEGESLDLPPDTLFPTGHMFRLVEAAAVGSPLLSSVVFNGTDLESLHDVTAFIGAEIPAGDAPPPRAGAEGNDAVKALAALRSWRISAAYFPVGSGDSRPEFEIAYRLFENGVAAGLTMDYGDFAMNGALAELEYASPSDC